MFYNYKLTWNDNHYVYVGFSCRPESRYKEHKKSCMNQKPDNHKLASVWKKHGPPTMTIVATFQTEKEGLEGEQFLIDQIFGESICLNLNPMVGKGPSNKGRKWSEETKAKLSATNKKEYANPVIATDPNGNQTEYSSACECARQIGFAKTSVTRLLKSGEVGERRKTRGWSFRRTKLCKN